MYDFNGKVALVTGGAAGLGFAIATRLANEGATIALVDVDEVALAEASAKLGESGSHVHTVVADVSSASDVDAAVKGTESAVGPIEMLINNAGICLFRSYMEYSDEDFDRQMNVNVKGTHLFMNRVLPGMVERGGGAIVNIASVAAFAYTVPHAVYAASKAAIVALSRDAAFEMARKGVRINCVAPGLIAVPPSRTKTPLLKADGNDGDKNQGTETRPMGFGRPSDIAGTVAFLLSDEARFIVGMTINVAGGTDLRTTMAFPDAPAR